jgi:hypothetical protein
MFRTRTGGVACAALLALGLALASRPSGATPGAGEPKIGHPKGHAFTEADRAHIKKEALAHVAAPKGQTVRVMSVSSHAIREGKETAENLAKHTAHALVFNYTTGKATRLTIDPATGKVTNTEAVRGSIESSKEERDEGVKIIQNDAKVFKKGNGVTGGFLVPAPKGEPATKVPHRYLLYEVTAGANNARQATVIVDMSAKRVVSSKK